MADQPLAEMVEIAVREFVTDPDGIQESSHPSGRDDSNHTGKRRRVEVTQLELEEGEDSIQALLYSAARHSASDLMPLRLTSTPWRTSASA
ncbi:uncharacterized protein [Narcine bancroftii]|uniref:uncharacterized protein isoform X2 n=1 Tax=Narcine bancroftii TaxID=1343680 RepID=UPI00383154AC